MPKKRASEPRNDPVQPSVQSTPVQDHAQGNVQENTGEGIPEDARRSPPPAQRSSGAQNRHSVLVGGARISNDIEVILDGPWSTKGEELVHGSEYWKRPRPTWVIPSFTSGTVSPPPKKPRAKRIGEKKEKEKDQNKENERQVSQSKMPKITPVVPGIEKRKSKPYPPEPRSSVCSTAIHDPPLAPAAVSTRTISKAKKPALVSERSEPPVFQPVPGPPLAPAAVSTRTALKAKKPAPVSERLEPPIFSDPSAQTSLCENPRCKKVTVLHTTWIDIGVGKSRTGFAKRICRGCYNRYAYHGGFWP